jgi:hypothetical protein
MRKELTWRNAQIALTHDSRWVDVFVNTHNAYATFTLTTEQAMELGANLIEVASGGESHDH